MRRGGVAIEFVLTAPILVTLLAGVVEWGNYLNTQTRVQETTRACTRTASQTPIEDDPEAEGRVAAEASLTAAGLDPDDARINVDLTGNRPNEIVTCRVEVDYAPLMGLVPALDTMSAEMTMRYEDQ